MIELAQHIEVLLLENDCVIVPGLGGFVAHYASSVRMDEENLFLPPVRVIGFNPQLKMNDGLLVQSYMAVYATNFVDATKVVEKEVRELLDTLHEEGTVSLSNIGELRCSICNTYDFIPYDNKITTPGLYGLDSFEMCELAERTQPMAENRVPVSFMTETEEKRRLEPIVGRIYWRNIAAMIAVVLLCSLLSVPVENTEVVEGNYAQLLPSELFSTIEKQSLAITPIVVRQSGKEQKKSAPSQSQMKKVIPVAVKEVKVGPVTTAPVEVRQTSVERVETVLPAAKKYHIIVASVGTEKDAERMTKQLVTGGFGNAKALVGDGKIRVSIESYETESEAYQSLAKIRQCDTYRDAWVLKK